MARFTDKVAIITGSSNGIGQATAVLFASEGAKVTITGRNSDRLEETKKLLLKANVPETNINVVIGDITQESVQETLIKTTLDTFGKIDILVNNAGAGIPDAQGKSGVNQSIDTYHKTFELNVQSVLEMTQKARPHLAKTQGEIVNISSIGAGPAAQVANPYYSIAKAALDQYTRTAAIDLVNENIRVNSVSPGAVSTGFSSVSRGLDDEKSKKMYEYLGSQRECIPRGFCAVPEDIAKVIAFLADRNASNYIIGQTIVADGGTSLILGAHAHGAKLVEAVFK
uniref:NAD(P)-binding protein n=1 Tax=Caenorhabditis tropicalis TaxID=1561998 RepID=A0A1I7U762_9PELO